MGVLASIYFTFVQVFFIDAYCIYCLASALIALLILPFFIYIPMAVIAAILVNTAVGLIEVHEFKKMWTHEKTSFAIALIVAGITVFHDAGTGVILGVVLALIFFVERVSHGSFDAVFSYVGGGTSDVRGEKTLQIEHDKDIAAVTYSVAGYLSYIDSSRHAANLRHLASAKNVRVVIIRLRDLFTIDRESVLMLADAVEAIERSGKRVLISSARKDISAALYASPVLHKIMSRGDSFPKVRDALHNLGLSAD